MTESALAVERLSAGYKGRTAIHDFDFEIEAGKVVSLLGPNGAGKSTLLKAVIGSVEVECGSVSVYGQLVSGIPAESIGTYMAYVPQQEEPRFGFTVYESILMGRIAHGQQMFETQEDHQTARWAADAMDCISILDRPITEISGGERQRALIARALTQRAPLMLLDEPTLHLDFKHRALLGARLQEHARAGGSVLVATHDAAFAAQFSDEAILLASGRLVLHDSAEAVLNSTAMDEVFETRFGRFTSSAGQTILFPEQEELVVASLFVPLGRSVGGAGGGLD